MRQAVVIIHGMGEQRPMSTLRGFVTSILNYEKSHHEDPEKEMKKRTFWTKPDRINDSYELRKVSSKGREYVRSTTHFYEYHWAGNMRDTTLRHVIRWFRSLMWSRENFCIAQWRLKILWVALWAGTVFWFYQLIQTIIDLKQSYNEWVFNMDTFNGGHWQWGVLLLPLMLIAFSRIMVHIIGDAARYLRVDVENIAQRETIRKNGVDLLKALHKSNDYDRIILVGHSLGSVIAYDIVTYLWIEFNKSIRLDIDINSKVVDTNEWGYEFGNLKFPDQDLTKMEELSKVLKDDPNNKELLLKFQNIQSKLWLKLQHNRKGWLISDFITLGSPLTHGEILMADKKADFDLRKEEREYPTCPPKPDGENYSYENGDDQRFLHHATPFAVTRWTNLYFPGDFIAGKVAPQFGYGISDIKVNYKQNLFWKLLSYISPLTHTHYWKASSTPQGINMEREYHIIEELYNAMRIADEKHKIYNPESLEENPDYSKGTQLN